MTVTQLESAARVELKICERCGGLWLRPANSEWIYCGICKKHVSGLPQPKLHRKAAAKAPTSQCEALSRTAAAGGPQ